MTDHLSPHLPDDVLNEYLDAALEPAARVAAETHLAACRACSARLASLSAVFSGLAQLPAAPLRRDLRAGVMAAVRAQPAAALYPLADPRRRPAQLVFGLQLLAALALLAFAWPFVAPLAGVERFFAPSILGGLTASLAGAGAGAGTLWPAFQSWLAGLVPQTALPLTAILQPVAASLVLVIAGLVWLLGNAFLLRPRATTRLRRSM